MNRPVVIIGYGQESQIVKEIINLNGDRIIGYLDDYKTDKEVLGKITDIDKLIGFDFYFINTITDNEVRKKICEENKNLKWYKAIHPDAIISKEAAIGCGCIIHAGTIVNNEAEIGPFTILNTGCIVEHNCKIHEYNHLCPRVTICGNVKIKELNTIGAGAVAINNIIINRKNVIGAGAVITKDILETNGVYAGIPVRKVREL